MYYQEWLARTIALQLNELRDHLVLPGATQLELRPLGNEGPKCMVGAQGHWRLQLLPRDRACEGSRQPSLYICPLTPAWNRTKPHTCDT